MLSSKNSSILYLSQECGNDHYAGYLPYPDGNGNGPLRTIRQLEKTIDTLRSSGFLRPLTVRFVGDFCLDKAIELHTTDITFESYGDTPARIIGGKVLTGFQADSFNGTPCISLHLPEVQSGAWKFTDLYVNGAPAAASRYPKVGTFEAITTEFPNNKGDVFDSLYDGSKWFIAKKEDLAGIRNIEDAHVSFSHFWIEEHSPIESYDPESGKLTLALRTRFNITTKYEENLCSDLHYYLENVADGFDSPGQWYLNTGTGMLYYIPKAGETIDNLEIVAPTAKHFALIRGAFDNRAAGIRFRNLHFLATCGEYVSKASGTDCGFCDEGFASDVQSCRDAHGAFQFENAEDCIIENCSIACAGVYAIDIYKGCTNIRVENCRITNCGAGGIKLWGTAAANDPDIRPSGCCKFLRNSISHCGLRYAAGCGIIIVHSAHNEIADNEISYTEYTGVSVGWEWGYMASSTYGNLIRGNHIHHIGQGKLSDMGGIYLLGKQHGTIVEGNLVHDVTSRHYGAMGIYTDEGSSYVTVENNIVYNCKGCCYQHHYGHCNTLKHNVFAFSGNELFLVCLCENNQSTECEENIFITNGKPIYRCKGQKIPIDLCSSNNTFWDISGNEPIMFRTPTADIYLPQWQEEYGFDFGSKIQKPSDEILKLVGVQESL